MNTPSNCPFFDWISCPCISALRPVLPRLAARGFMGVPEEDARLLEAYAETCSMCPRWVAEIEPELPR